MARRVIDTFWDRKTRNDINDNFKELYELREFFANGGTLNVNGGPKGTYQNLNELKSKHPNGDDGIYITLDDGKWNYWDGEEWKKGSVYQSQGIADKSIGSELLKGSLSSIIFDNVYELDFVIGGWNNYGLSDVKTRIRTDGPVRFTAGTTIGLTDYEGKKLNVGLYTDPSTINSVSGGWIKKDFTINETNDYIILLAYDDDREMTNTSLSQYLKPIYKSVGKGSIGIENLNESLLNLITGDLNPIGEYTEMERGTLNIGTGQPTSTIREDRARTKDYVKVKKGARIVVDRKYLYTPYLYDIDNQEFLGRVSNVNGTFEFPHDCYFKIVVYYQDDNEISDKEIEEMNEFIKVSWAVGGNKNEIMDKRFYFADSLEGEIDFPIENIYMFDNPSNNQVDDVYSKFDEFVNDHAGYATQTIGGSDSDGNDINIYKFTPKLTTPNDNYTDRAYKNPKIILTGAVHGNEKGGTYGIYNLMNMICNHWRSYSILRFMRFNIDFTVIPIVNPSGFNAYTRNNSEGKDLNRSFPRGISTTGDYSDKPKETQVIIELMKECRNDAVMWVDYHNMYWRDELLSYVTGEDKSMNHSGIRAIDKITKNYQLSNEHFPQEVDHEFGYQALGVNNSVTDCATISGIPCSTLEVVRKIEWQDSWKLYDEYVNKFSSELLATFIVTYIKNTII